jgi:hypothetical protein
LLNTRTEYAESKSPSFGVLFAEWRENQELSVQGC